MPDKQQDYSHFPKSAYRRWEEERRQQIRVRAEAFKGEGHNPYLCSFECWTKHERDRA